MTGASVGRGGARTPQAAGECLSRRVGGPARSGRRRIAIVLWDGTIGGAETLMANLAGALEAHAVDARVLFIAQPEPLCERLHAQGISWASLGHARGAGILLAARRMTSTLSQLGPDGAIVNATGYLPWLIRRCGFRGPMLAVEHGDALNLDSALLRRRLRVRVERLLCARGDYLDIAVSDTVRAAAIRATGRQRVRRIYNGVDLERFSPRPSGSDASASVRIGVACRLTPGKGVNALLGACELLGSERAWSLRIAGEGPEAQRLRARADTPALAGRVRFEGRVSEMPDFWRGCEIAVVPSHEWIESFSMAAVEAMACGLPLVASAAGALPEICGDCAELVPPGDPASTAAALARYLDQPGARARASAASRARAEQMFAIAGMARGYIDALGDPDSEARSPRTGDRGRG